MFLKNEYFVKLTHRENLAFKVFLIEAKNGREAIDTAIEEAGGSVWRVDSINKL